MWIKVHLLLLIGVAALVPQLPPLHCSIAMKRQALLGTSAPSLGATATATVVPAAPLIRLLHRWERTVVAVALSVILFLCSLFTAALPAFASSNVSGGKFHASTFDRPNTPPRRRQQQQQQRKTSSSSSSSSFSSSSPQRRSSESTSAALGAAAAVWDPASSHDNRRPRHPAIVMAQLTAAVLIPVFVAPYVLEVVLALTGVRSSAVSEVQVVLRLSQTELAALVAALQRAVAGSELLEERVRDVCTTLLRRDDAIVAGSMLQVRLPYSYSFARAQDLFLQLSMTERMKFDDDDNGRPSGVAVHMDAEAPRTSLAVVTLLLLSRGPVLRSPGWARKAEATRPHPLTRMHLLKALTQLEGYLRVINEDQRKYLREHSSNDTGDGGDTPPGVEINVFWTPNNAMETLTEQDVQRQWPSVRAL